MRSIGSLGLRFAEGLKAVEMEILVGSSVAWDKDTDAASELKSGSCLADKRMVVSH